MKYTSAEAAKLLRSLNEEQYALKQKESISSTFVAAVGEDLESTRPAYDYKDMQNKLIQLEAKIRSVKHSINKFNLEHIVPGFDMTIDQILVYIPQLTERKQKLSMMRSRLPKQRENTSSFRGTPIIEYEYTNYDVEEAEKDYKWVSDELAKAQTALDVMNSSETMEIEI
ncbi:hypothetical protein DSECCO2_188930 [anaerobic digester metagenome]